VLPPSSAPVSTTYADFRLVHTRPGTKLVNAVLALTMLVSPVVYIEPSPYEGMVFVLAVVAFASGLPIERRVVPLIALLMVWAAGGLFALMPAFSDNQAVVYYGISIYLMASTVMFVCLFAEDTGERMATLANAYIIAALGVSLVAIAGYFHLIPGADVLIQGGRAKGTFKDPNVFAPYLVFPLLVLIQRIFHRGLRLSYVAAVPVLLFAIFIAFSRGAWGNVVLSALVMVVLMIFISPAGRFRRRLIGLSAAVAAAVVLVLTGALAIPSVHKMFEVRAELLQPYDTGGANTRFGRQQEAVGVVLSRPNGLGPRQFAHVYLQDTHNVYLNALISYGWLGGLAYLGVVLSTLALGMRAILRASPWRSYLVAAYAAFVGVVGEGLVIDTDHWRHFFLLIGIIWGVSIAAGRYRRSPPATAATG